MRRRALSASCRRIRWGVDEVPFDPSIPQGERCRFRFAQRANGEADRSLPSRGPLVPAIRSNLGVRRRIVRGFPFALAYLVSGETIRIDAVAHMHRRPGYWRRRVR
jgi:hypothetical protein